MIFEGDCIELVQVCDEPMKGGGCKIGCADWVKRLIGGGGFRFNKSIMNTKKST